MTFLMLHSIGGDLCEVNFALVALYTPIDAGNPQTSPTKIIFGVHGLQPLGVKETVADIRGKLVTASRALRSVP